MDFMEILQKCLLKDNWEQRFFVLDFSGLRVYTDAGYIKPYLTIPLNNSKIYPDTVNLFTSLIQLVANS